MPRKPMRRKFLNKQTKTKTPKNMPNMRTSHTNKLKEKKKMGTIKSIKIEYFDTDRFAYKEFPEDRDVTITAEVTHTEKIVWK